MITATEFITGIIEQDIEDGEIPVAVSLSPNLYSTFQELCGGYLIDSIMWDEQFEVKIEVDYNTDNTVAVKCLPLMIIEMKPTTLRLV